MMLERFSSASIMGEEGSFEIDCEGTSVRIFEWNDVNGEIARAKLGNSLGPDGMNAELLLAIWRVIPG